MAKGKKKRNELATSLIVGVYASMTVEQKIAAVSRIGNVFSHLFTGAAVAEVPWPASNLNPLRNPENCAGGPCTLTGHRPDCEHFRARGGA